MPQQQWSDKREREYKHIKSAERDRGVNEQRAEEIAARTVNKDRTRAGESRQASESSLEDMSPPERGGQRSGRPGPRGRTRAQLYAEARRRNIKGRSQMTKKQLETALVK